MGGRRLLLRRRSRRGVLLGAIVGVMMEIAVVEVEVAIAIEAGVVFAIAVEAEAGLEVVLEDAWIVWRKTHRP